MRTDYMAAVLQLFKINLGAVYAHLMDPLVQEVMINHPSDVWIERAGETIRLDVSLDPAQVVAAITNLANINETAVSPLLDCRLPKLRIAATLPPVAPDGPSMCIRRHSAIPLMLEDYLARGALLPGVSITTPQLVSVRPDAGAVVAGGQALIDLIAWAMESRKNLIISGSTSSGKSTLLNAVLAKIPPHLRVGIVEDTCELTPTVPNHFRFEAARGTTMAQCAKHLLRYRPNCIIFGEVRGAEAMDMLSAYGSGHPGSAVTFHADEARLAPYRLETMVRMNPEAANWPLTDLRRAIATTFRFVVHCSNTFGHRGPEEVLEILGVEDGDYVTKSLFKKSFSYVTKDAKHEIALA